MKKNTKVLEAMEIPTLDELNDLPVESDLEIIKNEINKTMLRLQGYEDAA